MKKELNAGELALFIEERQAKTVRALRQQWKVEPKLAIVTISSDQFITSHVTAIQAYGDDIGIGVDVHATDAAEAPDIISTLNSDDSIHGIIVQTPDIDTPEIDIILNTVRIEKDIAGLVAGSIHPAVTPVAITWLLAGYDINLQDKKIVIVGKGRAVADPLSSMLKQSGFDAIITDPTSDDLSEVTKEADILITAAHTPGLITERMVKYDVVIVDASVTSGVEGGDISASVYDLPDVKITSREEGAEPLMVASLYESLLTSAKKSISTTPVTLKER